MTLLIYTSLVWLFVGVFLTLPHQKNRLAYLFLFIVFSVVNINVNHIRFEKFHLTTYPKDLLHYFSLIIDRSVLVPMILVFMVYFVKNSKTKVGKFSWSVFWVLFLGAYDWLGILLEVNIYKGWWNTSYSVLLFLCYFLLAMVMSGWFEKQECEGGRK
jgi:hypothetical protein